MWVPCATNGGRLVFVMGCGRSGTHWLGAILAGSSEVAPRTEQEPCFGWVTEMAMNPARVETLFPKTCRIYRQCLKRASAPFIAEKTHPSMWIAERLAEVFDDALFIGVQRNAYATIASMLRHKGVTLWTAKWREYPVPNRFLGIATGDSDRYESLSNAEKHAMRWRAHAERMSELRHTLGSRFACVSYEQLQCDTPAALRLIGTHLGLSERLPVPEIKATSLDKWKHELSCDDMPTIEAVVTKTKECLFPGQMHAPGPKHHDVTAKST